MHSSSSGRVDTATAVYGSCGAAAAVVESRNSCFYCCCTAAAVLNC